MSITIRNVNDDDAERGTLSDNLYVLGRRTAGTRGLLQLGRYYALDQSLGSTVYVDGADPHVVLICGKRGYGKSYTLGTFMEEMARLDDDVRRALGLLVVDTLGIFWTSRYGNARQEELLERWGYEPQGLDIRLLTRPGQVDDYTAKGIDAAAFQLRTSEVTPAQWCQLFDAAPTDPLGVAVTRVVTSLEPPYGIEDIVAALRADQRTPDQVTGAAENFFEMAAGWNVFSPDGMPLDDIVIGGRVTVLDMSAYPEELKAVVVAVLARTIFERRIRERRRDEERQMQENDDDAGGFPLVWMVIDEAQVFLPDEPSMAKDVLIKQWMRQGRQPGVSLLMATQRPSALDPEVLSHSDMIICHRLTAQQDIEALNMVRPTYMQGSISQALKKVGTEKGVALIVDDTSESVHVIKVRPRLSWHGGEEPSALW